MDGWLIFIFITQKLYKHDYLIKSIFISNQISGGYKYKYKNKIILKVNKQFVHRNFQHKIIKFINLIQNNWLTCLGKFYELL